MVRSDCRLIDPENYHVYEFRCKIGGRVVATYGVPWRPKGFLLRSVEPFGLRRISGINRSEYVFDWGNMVPYGHGVFRTGLLNNIPY